MVVPKRVCPDLPMNTSIRAASAADYPTIQALAQAIWPSAYSEIISASQIDYMLTRMYSESSLAAQTQQGHVLQLALEGDTPVGFVSHQFDYPNARTTKIHKLYVLPSTQGRGVGRSLIDHVSNSARAAGQHALTLNVNIRNQAQDFYRRVGFVVIGREDIDIGAGFLMEDAIMTRTL